MKTTEKPKKENYGWHSQDGFDDLPSGWAFEGGEEAYGEAITKWENKQTTGFIPNSLTGPFEIEQAIAANGSTTITNNFCKNYHSELIIEELVEMFAKSDIRINSSQIETLNYNEATNLFDIKIDGVRGVNKDGDIKVFISTQEANLNGYLTTK